MEVFIQERLARWQAAADAARDLDLLAVRANEPGQVANDFTEHASLLLKLLTKLHTIKGAGEVVLQQAKIIALLAELPPSVVCVGAIHELLAMAADSARQRTELTIEEVQQLQTPALKRLVRMIEAADADAA